MHVDMSLIQHRQPLIAVEWILNGHIQPFAASWLSPQPTSDQAAHLPELAKPTATEILYIYTAPMSGNVIIEDDSFSLGTPTPMEMLEQHALLFQGENEQLQQNLSRSRKNIEKLVVINQGQADEVSRLNTEVERLNWRLSLAHVENTELKNRQLGGYSPTWGGTAPGNQHDK